MSTNQLISCLIIFTLTFNLQIKLSLACKFPWEGFGVYLGSLASFNLTTEETQSSIFNHLYNDLKLRNYRTEFPPQFSQSEDNYSIDCIDIATCSWINIHSMFSRLIPLDEVSLIVSIWSPPHYMKSAIGGLKTSYEQSYYYYIKNITLMVKQQFGLSIDQISVVNEPENIFAQWDSCTMLPNQLCRIVQMYDDPKISLCPENAWYPTSEIYRNFKFGEVNCRSACSIITSHGYKFSFNPFDHFGTVSYDLSVYSEDTKSPVWITEISSTRSSAQIEQIDEALEMSISIVNFVGKTCVQRWYYWAAFTNSPSGESLIWFNQSTNQLDLPKKYYAYRHFTQASYGSNDRVDCSTNDYHCLQFKPNRKTVWVNSNSKEKQIKLTCNNLCCTTINNNLFCSQTNILPPKSICSC